MTPQELKALQERCRELVKKRQKADAAELADTITHLPPEVLLTGEEQVDWGWGVCEILGDYDARHNPERARRLYQVALVCYQDIAATQRLTFDVERVQRKIALLDNPPKTWWQRILRRR